MHSSIMSPAPLSSLELIGFLGLLKVISRHYEMVNTGNLLRTQWLWGHMDLIVPALCEIQLFLFSSHQSLTRTFISVVTHSSRMLACSTRTVTWETSCHSNVRWLLHHSYFPKNKLDLQFYFPNRKRICPVGHHCCKHHIHLIHDGGVNPCLNTAHTRRGAWKIRIGRVIRKRLNFGCNQKETQCFLEVILVYRLK